MTFRTAVIGTVLVGIIYAAYGWNSDPHNTKLPFGTTNLSTVEKQLARLPKDERALVEAYVTRSNGDVLPPKFADSDNPLTARTFAEAIELQRAWNEKMKVLDARLAVIHADHEAKLAPLRAVVNATVVKAEVMTRNEFQERRNPGFLKMAHTVDKSPAFLTTIRVENLSDQTIVGMHGSLEASDTEAYLKMDLCWIDLNGSQPIPAGSSIEILCGHDYRGASQQQRDFVDNSNGRFKIIWEPKDVKFENGKVLKSGL
jgi:hypothetical protein